MRLGVISAVLWTLQLSNPDDGGDGRDGTLLPWVVFSVNARGNVVLMEVGVEWDLGSVVCLHKQLLASRLVLGRWGASSLGLGIFWHYLFSLCIEGLFLTTSLLLFARLFTLSPSRRGARGTGACSNKGGGDG